MPHPYQPDRQNGTSSSPGPVSGAQFLVIGAAIFALDFTITTPIIRSTEYFYAIAKL
jgi:hypothetical protein